MTDTQNAQHTVWNRAELERRIPGAAALFNTLPEPRGCFAALAAYRGATIPQPPPTPTGGTVRMWQDSAASCEKIAQEQRARAERAEAALSTLDADWRALLNSQEAGDMDSPRLKAARKELRAQEAECREHARQIIAAKQVLRLAGLEVFDGQTIVELAENAADRIKAQDRANQDWRALLKDHGYTGNLLDSTRIALIERAELRDRLAQNTAAPHAEQSGSDPSTTTAPAKAG